MQKKIDLVNGPVLSSLTRLAVPIMATSLIQMAYNMTDMIWIGRIGSSAVASVGAANVYVAFQRTCRACKKWEGRLMSDMHLGHLIVKRPQNMHPTRSAYVDFGDYLWTCLYIRAKPLIHFFPSESGTGDPGCHILS